MRRASLILLILITLLPLAGPAYAGWARTGLRQESAPNLFINTPLPGAALQGTIPIEGNTAVAGFQSAYLSFGYTDDPTGTWFLIYETTSPVAYGTIAQWDTTTITDGDYNLRLIVALNDGSTASTVVEGLRVRNYSPIETDTPTPPPPTATSLPPTPGQTVLLPKTSTPSLTATMSATPIPPTLTPLPTNPAELSPHKILTSLGKGALVSLGLFALLGIYLAARSAWYRRS